MDNKPKLCLIETNSNSTKYTISTKLLDSPTKTIKTNNLYILNFIKKEFNPNLNTHLK